MIEYEYSITEKNWEDFNKYHYRTSSALFFRRNLYWIASIAMAVFMLIVGYFQKAPIVEFIVLWSAFTLFVAVVRIIEPWLVGRTSKRMLRQHDNTFLYGPLRLTINSDHIATHTNNVDARYAHGDIKYIGQDARTIYLYVSSVQAIIVPKKIFANAGAVEEFLESAGAFIGDKKAAAPD